MAELRRPQIPHKPADFNREWQRCNINVMVDAPRPPPHPYIRIIVKISTSRQKKREREKKKTHNVTAAAHMHFNESRHKKWIRRHLRITCLCNPDMVVGFLFYFKTDADMQRSGGQRNIWCLPRGEITRSIAEGKYKSRASSSLLGGA